MTSHPTSESTLRTTTNAWWCWRQRCCSFESELKRKTLHKRRRSRVAHRLHEFLCTSEYPASCAFRGLFSSNTLSLGIQLLTCLQRLLKSRHKKEISKPQFDSGNNSSIVCHLSLESSSSSNVSCPFQVSSLFEFWHLSRIVLELCSITPLVFPFDSHFLFTLVLSWMSSFSKMSSSQNSASSLNSWFLMSIGLFVLILVIQPCKYISFLFLFQRFTWNVEFLWCFLRWIHVWRTCTV